MTTNDFLSFVKLVRQHYREAKIKLTPEIVKKMDEILSSSNPPTLREALRKLLISFDTKIEQHLNKALDEGRVKPDFRTGAFYVLHELADLAASGTEAAPSDEHQFYSRGTMQELNKQMAAARPEGEGRDWRPDEDVTLLDGLRLNSPMPSAPKRPEEFSKLPSPTHRCNDENCPACGLPRQPRQSAAPSGGAALTLEQVIAVLQRVDSESVMGDEEQVGEQFIYRNVGPILLTKFLNELFAQESKAGVVTETK